MSKIIYLHIGVEKTGTTALQKFFKINEHCLKKRGILYPNSFRRELHNHSPLVKLINPRDCNDLKSLLNSNFEKEKISLDKEIDSFKEKIILFSSEHLSSRLNQKEKIRKLEFLSNYGKVIVIIYVRRQDQAFMSQYDTGIKVSVKNCLKDFMSQSDYFQYFKIVSNYMELTSKENIVVRPYEKQQFYKANIFADFLHYAFNLELDNEFIIPGKNLNPRFSRDVLEFKRYINKLDCDQKDKIKINSYLLRISEQEDPNTQKTFQDNSFLSPRERLDIINKYEESNALIAREYLCREDGRLFFDPLPDPNEFWEPYPGLSIEKAIKIGFNIVQMQNEEMQKLQNQTLMGKVKNLMKNNPELKKQLIKFKLLLNFCKRIFFGNVTT